MPFRDPRIKVSETPGKILVHTKISIWTDLKVTNSSSESKSELKRKGMRELGFSGENRLKILEHGRRLQVFEQERSHKLEFLSLVSAISWQYSTFVKGPESLSQHVGLCQVDWHWRREQRVLSEKNTGAKRWSWQVCQHLWTPTRHLCLYPCVKASICWTLIELHPPMVTEWRRSFFMLTCLFKVLYDLDHFHLSLLIIQSGFHYEFQDGVFFCHCLRPVCLSRWHLI